LREKKYEFNNAFAKYNNYCHKHGHSGPTLGRGVTVFRSSIAHALVGLPDRAGGRRHCLLQFAIAKNYDEIFFIFINFIYFPVPFYRKTAFFCMIGMIIILIVRLSPRFFDIRINDMVALLR